MKIPYKFYDAMLTADLKKNEQDVLWFLYRLSHGCTDSCIIKRYKRFEAIGIGKTHVREVVQGLIEKNMLSKNDTVYKINMNVDEWQVKQHDREQLDLAVWENRNREKNDQ